MGRQDVGKTGRALSCASAMAATLRAVEVMRSACSRASASSRSLSSLSESACHIRADGATLGRAYAILGRRVPH
eukprot:4473339-Prymnesium_polylepis.1